MLWYEDPLDLVKEMHLLRRNLGWTLFCNDSIMESVGFSAVDPNRSDSRGMWFGITHQDLSRHFAESCYDTMRQVFETLETRKFLEDCLNKVPVGAPELFPKKRRRTRWEVLSET